MEALHAVLILETTGPAETGKTQGPGSLMAKAKQALKNGTGFGGGLGEETFLVQYNPTSLKFSGNAGIYQEEEEKKENQIKGAGYLSMSVDLVFHAVNEGDASVFHTMEKMMQTIKTSATKGVKFAWGNILVEGEITGFNGSYKMFNLLGMPLSATAGLTIRIKAKTSSADKRMEDMAKGQGND